MINYSKLEYHVIEDMKYKNNSALIGEEVEFSRAKAVDQHGTYTLLKKISFSATQVWT